MDITSPVSLEPLPGQHDKRRLTATVLGVVAGSAAIAGIWLPLAFIAGFGPVGILDYSHPRAYACVAAAALVVVFSLTRHYQLVLLGGIVLCGVLSVTAFGLYQWLRDALGIGSDDGQSSSQLAQMAREMIAHSSLRSGAYVLPISGICCVAAGLLGITSRRAVVPASTSES